MRFEKGFTLSFEMRPQMTASGAVDSSHPTARDDRCWLIAAVPRGRQERLLIPGKATSELRCQHFR
jgi:hypothetical protein